MGRAKAAGSKPAAPRQRLSPAARRAQIIDAARDLFGEGGIGQVSMRAIARRVGITQAAIYQHFDDKEAILFAISEDFFGRLIEANKEVMASATTPIDQLRRSMAAYVRTGLAWPEEYRLVFMTSISGLETRGAHRMVPGLPEQISPTKGTTAFAYLQDQVRALMDAGQIRKGDVDVTSEAIWAAGHGIVSLLITHVNFPWEREKLIETQLDMLIFGLLPEESRERAPAPSAQGRRNQAGKSPKA